MFMVLAMLLVLGTFLLDNVAATGFFFVRQ